MPCEKFSLPAYPCTRDMWDELKAEKRPIVIYGMGNGADKLIERLDGLGIEFADIFASDGFVRGHSFHGVRVKTLEEIRMLYPDFVILLSFASNREEVLYMLSELDMRFDMYVPDMPVAGVEEYFDREFYNENYSEILRAYEALADAESKNTFAAIVNFKLSGRMKFLLSAHCQRGELYGLLPCDKIEAVIDAGAYNGDTAREAKAYFPNLKKVYALEPDSRNFKKLVKYSEAENEISVIPINAAAWCENVLGEFFDSGNRNSTAVATTSYEHKKIAVPMRTLDSITEDKIDYIKYDVEGAELEALVGSERIITAHHPALLVSLYHRSRDIFSIPNMLAEKYPYYRFYLRRLKCLPAWEIDLIMLPT